MIIIYNICDTSFTRFDKLFFSHISMKKEGCINLHSFTCD